MTYLNTAILMAVLSLGACATTGSSEAPMDQQYLKSYGSPLVYDLIQGKSLQNLPKTEIELNKIDIALNDTALTDLGRLALTKYRVKILADRNDKEGVRASYANLAKSVTDSNLRRYAQSISIPKDSDAQSSLRANLLTPLIRIPPKMPMSADNTGFCRLKLDVQPSGTPTNVKATYCTRDIFEAAAVNSVLNWKYEALPTDKPFYGVETQITFSLKNERGLIKPY